MRVSLVLSLVMVLSITFGRVAFADDVPVAFGGTMTPAQEYEKLYKLIIAEGFDPDKRYLEDEMARIHENGGRDPFWCGRLDVMIEGIATLSKGMGDNERYKMWRTHEADYLMTNHICEDGHPYPRPSDAYEIYLELGLVADANRAALMESEDHLFAAAYGMNIYRPWSDIDEQRRADHLLEGIEWLRKAGKPDEFVLARLNAWGHGLEAGGYNLSAARFYAACRQMDDTIRALTKARTNPVPSDTQLGQDFINFLGAAEAHP